MRVGAQKEQKRGGSEGVWRSLPDAMPALDGVQIW